MSDCSQVLLSPRSIIGGAFMGSGGHGKSSQFDSGLNERALFMGASFDEEFYPDDAGPHADAASTSDYIPVGEIAMEDEEWDDDVYFNGDDEDDDEDVTIIPLDFVDHFVETESGNDEDDVLPGPRSLEPIRPRSFDAGFKSGRSYGSRGRNQKATPKKRERLSIRRPSVPV